LVTEVVAPLLLNIPTAYLLYTLLEEDVTNAVVVAVVAALDASLVAQRLLSKIIAPDMFAVLHAYNVRLSTSLVIFCRYSLLEHVVVVPHPVMNV
jgi:small basic protein